MNVQTTPCKHSWAEMAEMKLKVHNAAADLKSEIDLDLIV